MFKIGHFFFLNFEFKIKMTNINLFWSILSQNSPQSDQSQTILSMIWSSVKIKNVIQNFISCWFLKKKEVLWNIWSTLSTKIIICSPKRPTVSFIKVLVYSKRVNLSFWTTESKVSKWVFTNLVIFKMFCRELALKAQDEF